MNQIDNASRLRIALVTTEFVTEKNFDGGLANYIYRIALALTQIGHDVVVFVEAGTDESLHMDGFQLIRVGRRQHRVFQCINILTLKRLNYASECFRLSWNVNHAVRQEHARQPFDVAQYTQLGGIGLWRLPQVPTVVRLSSYAKLWQRYGEFSRLSRLAIWQYHWLEHWALGRSDSIFGPCQSVAAYVERDLHRPVATIASPYLRTNFLLDEQIHATHLAGKKYILYFGRLSPAKGVLVLGRILYDLLQREPDLNVVFVGKETNGWQGKPIMDHILALAGPFHPRVRYLGSLPQNQLFPIIRYAHTVVFPALVDNLPNACLEAMYFERVIVATKATGFDQLLVHGKSGLLCRAGDEQALLEVLDQALHLADHDRQIMGRAARAKLENFNPEKIAREHVGLYRRVRVRT
jgi:glycogen(starch) synthase